MTGEVEHHVMFHAFLKWWQALRTVDPSDMSIAEQAYYAGWLEARKHNPSPTITPTE